MDKQKLVSLKLSPNALNVLNKRYLKKKDGKSIEIPEDMFKRIAENIASAETIYNPKITEVEIKNIENKFYNLMASLDFLPNSPTLMNAGRELQQLSACFVLPIEDSMEGIFETIKDAAIIHKSGGGCIAKGSKIYTSFCGLEDIDILYEKLSERKKISKFDNGEYFDINKDDIFTYSFNKYTGSFEKDKVLKIWKYNLPADEIYSISGEGNIKLTTSSWHPFFVFEDGKIKTKRADEIKAGDYLITANYSLLNQWFYQEYYRTSNLIIDEDFSYLVGYFLGDGSIGRYKDKLRLRFFDEHKYVLKNIVKILQRFTNTKYSIQKDNRCKTLYIVCYNQELIKNLLDLTKINPGEKSKEITIPEFVWKSPLSVVYSFIAGLFDSDGYVHRDKIKLTYSTASEEFSMELKSLLHLLGFTPSIRKRSAKKENWSEMYEVGIEGLNQIKRFAIICGDYLINRKRKDRIKIYSKGNHTAKSCSFDFSLLEKVLNEVGINTKNTSIWRKSILIGNKKFFLARWKEGKGVSLDKVLDTIDILLSFDSLSSNSRNYLNTLKFVLSSLIKVTRIEKGVDISEFYDLTVENNKNYLAGKNGLAVIHNTGFSFSRIRPKSDSVKTTGGVASGPVSFMKVFNSATEAVKQGGCVVPETRISTGKGIVQIKEFKPFNSIQNSWYSLNGGLLVATDNGNKKATEFYDNGIAKIIKITTKHGYSISATLEHRLKVIDDEGKYVWKYFKDIANGDWVALQKNTFLSNGNYKFPEFNITQHFNAKKIKIPDYPTKELGEAIGFFIGDGSVNINSSGTGRFILSIGDYEKEVISHMLEVIEELFGLKPVIQKKKDDKSTNYFYNSTVLVQWLKHIGVEKESTLNVKVPELVFRSNAEFSIGFLCGLFSADGTVTEEGYPSLTSISNILIKDTQLLLLSLGIPSSISVKTNRKGAFGKNPLHVLRIITDEGRKIFYETIGFFDKEKNERIRTNLNKSFEYNDVIPNLENLLRKIYNGPGRGCSANRASRGANRKLYRNIQHYLSNVSTKRNLTRLRLKKLTKEYSELLNSGEINWFLNNNQFYDTVEKIEFFENQTFDLSVPEGNTYIANGFVSHNTRRGANMGILRVDHPDILEFITSKQDTKELTNFNISVAITEKFMQAVEKDEEYELLNPRTKQAIKKFKARDVFNLIVESAWKTGEPGIIFIDRINKDNPTPSLGEIESTNPCGEQPLLPHEACNLGSINLVHMVKSENGKYIIDFEHLKETIHVGVRFLDNVIDMNRYPLPSIDRMAKTNRKIGLGVMGFADMLIQLKIPYNSDEALEIASKIMEFIEKESKIASSNLSKERGCFSNFIDSIYYKSGSNPLRNATTTTIAPTGTLSIIADCSSGIEPIFALSYIRKILDKTEMLEVNKYFEEIAKEKGFYSEELMKEIAGEGSIQNIEYIPEDIKKIFVTAHDISPEWHIKMQSVFQKWTDNAVSKTVNFSAEATKEDVAKVYFLAYKEGCKGVTVYRDKSRDEQVLSTGKKEEKSNQPTVVNTHVMQTTEEGKIAPRARPQVTLGQTQKIGTGCGNFYVTINEDNKGLFEIFAHMGKSGGCAASQTEAISRLVSLALRSGVEIEAILKQIKGIRCPSPYWDKGNIVLSCPDAIAKAIERYSKNNVELNSKKDSVRDKSSNGTNRKNIGGMCPDCGNILEYVEDCVICRFCGYTKCG